MELGFSVFSHFLTELWFSRCSISCVATRKKLIAALLFRWNKRFRRTPLLSSRFLQFHFISRFHHNYAYKIKCAKISMFCRIFCIYLLQNIDMQQYTNPLFSVNAYIVTILLTAVFCMANLYAGISKSGKSLRPRSITPILDRHIFR